MALELKRHQPQDGNIPQINHNKPRTHHDALEFPDGQIWLLTLLREGQQATVLQLPAAGTGSKALDDRASLRAAVPIAPR